MMVGGVRHLGDQPSYMPAGYGVQGRRPSRHIATQPGEFQRARCCDTDGQGAPIRARLPASYSPVPSSHNSCNPGRVSQHPKSGGDRGLDLRAGG